MRSGYHVLYDGPKTRIIETPTGEWAKFNAARVAAIEHVEEVLADAHAALAVLRRSGTFLEYMLHMGEKTP